MDRQWNRRDRSGPGSWRAREEAGTRLLGQHDGGLRRAASLKGQWGRVDWGCNVCTPEGAADEQDRFAGQAAMIQQGISVRE
jgi:hypothetical protein